AVTSLRRRAPLPPGARRYAHRGFRSLRAAAGTPGGLARSPRDPPPAARDLRLSPAAHQGAARQERELRSPALIGLVAVTDLPAPFDEYRDVVRPEWIDHNGKMNMGYYVVVFDFATDAFLAWAGLGEAHRSAQQVTTFCLE